MLIPGRDGGSIYDADPEVCEEDHAAAIDQDVVLSLGVEKNVLNIVIWAEYR